MQGFVPVIFTRGPILHLRCLPHCSLNFTADVSLTDKPKGDQNFMGSELGLTTRFARHVADPVAKALSVSNMPVKFGNAQAYHRSPWLLPDVNLAISGPDFQRATVIAVGELKTCWTLELDYRTIRSALSLRTYSEPYTGRSFNV